MTDTPRHNGANKLNMPHIGMRKIKSVIALFIGFLFWQCIRIFFPSLEVHPVYIYIYGLLEIRENSEKTVDFGYLRIKATFIALGIGLPFLFLADLLKAHLTPGWAYRAVELGVLMIGALLTLILAEKAKCKTYCGLSAVVFIILVVSHANDEKVLYAVLRATQTIIGVFIAWLLNVRLLPYPQKPSRHTL